MTSDVIHSSYRFREFDSFIEVAKSFDWSPVQLSTGQLDLRYNLVDAHDFGAFELGFAPKVHDRSVVQEGFVSFSLVFGHCKFAGMEATPGTIAVLFDGRDYRSTFEKGFSCTEFYVRRDTLAGHPLGPILLQEDLDPHQMTFAIDTPSAYRVRSILRDLIHSPTLFLEGAARDATRTAVLNTFYRLIAPRLGQTKLLMPKVQRADLTFDALRYLEQNDFNLSVNDLAAALGVGRRALELSFGSVIGVSPGQFLLARKLTRARDALEQGSGKVVDIAWREGFEHPSRFAYQYSRLFLEKPSETLQRVQKLNR